METRTVLLVENEPVIAVLTRIDLENLGFHVLSASTGADAIRIAETNSPEIVLMDFQLDGDLDGADTANEIQNRFKIPILFLTGCADIEKVHKCLATKPFGFIRKPCRTEDLRRALEHVTFQQSLMQRFQHSASPVDSENATRVLLGDSQRPFAA